MNVQEDKEEIGRSSTSIFEVESKQYQTCLRSGKIEHFKAQCISMQMGGKSWKVWSGIHLKKLGANKIGSSVVRVAVQAIKVLFSVVVGGGCQQNHHGHGNKDGHIWSFCTLIQLKTELYEPTVDSCVGEVQSSLGSGCSDHLVCNGEYFYESIVEIVVNVKRGNGLVLNACKIDNIFHKFCV